MINFLRQMFSEKSDISSMRIMAIIALLVASVIAFIGMSSIPIDYSGLSLLVGTFLSAAFGGKILQKKTEISGAKSESEIAPKSTKPNIDNPDA